MAARDGEAAKVGRSRVEEPKAPRYVSTVGRLGCEEAKEAGTIFKVRTRSRKLHREVGPVIGAFLHGRRQEARATSGVWAHAARCDDGVALARIPSAREEGRRT